MKAVSCAVAIVVVGSMLAITAHSQYNAGERMGRRGGAGRQMPSVDDQVKNLTKQLKLSDDQQKQVRTILQDQRDRMQQQMQNSSASREDRRSKMREIHQSASGKIRDLLNDDQKKRYDEYQQKQMERMQQRRGGMGQQGPPQDE